MKSGENGKLAQRLHYTSDMTIGVSEAKLQGWHNFLFFYIEHCTMVHSKSKRDTDYVAHTRSLLSQRLVTDLFWDGENHLYNCVIMT